MTREDLEAIVKLYLRAYKGLEEYAYTHPKDVKAYIKWLLKRDPEGFVLKRDGSKIVAFVAGDANWFSKREGKNVGAIHEIVVDPDYWGRGIGKTLMNRTLNYFLGKGLDLAELWVGDRNERAINFYKRLGFEEKDRYNYWIRMVKKLR